MEIVSVEPFGLLPFSGQRGIRGMAAGIMAMGVHPDLSLFLEPDMHILSQGVGCFAFGTEERLVISRDHVHIASMVNSLFLSVPKHMAYTLAIFK